MNGQLSIGAVLIVMTVVIHGISFETLTGQLKRHGPGWIGKRPAVGALCLTVLTVLGIFVTHTIEVWLWAALYVGLGEIETFRTALYFSTVTYTTLGYGDVTLSERWQILGALQAVNGILLFGWSTAFLFSVLSRISAVKDRSRS